MTDIPPEQIEAYRKKLTALVGREVRVDFLLDRATYQKIPVLSFGVSGYGGHDAQVNRAIDGLAQLREEAGVTKEMLGFRYDDAYSSITVDLAKLHAHEQAHPGAESVFARLAPAQKKMQAVIAEAGQTIEREVAEADRQGAEKGKKAAWGAEGYAEEQEWEKKLADLKSYPLKKSISLDGQLVASHDWQHTMHVTNTDFAMPETIRTGALTEAKKLFGEMRAHGVKPEDTREFARYATLDGKPGLTPEEAASALIEKALESPMDTTYRGAGPFPVTVEGIPHVTPEGFSKHIATRSGHVKDPRVSFLTAQQILTDTYGVTIEGRDADRAKGDQLYLDTARKSPQSDRYR